MVGIEVKVQTKTNQLPPAEITIISVTKNDLEGIRRTVESVKAQDYPAWKLVIVLSSASDSSLQYVDELKQKNENIVFIIPDTTGIYQAMNFAVKKIQPKLTWFLNGGDIFENKSILSIAHKYMMKFDPSVLIGGYAIVEKGKKQIFIRKKRVITQRRFSLNIRSGNHQAMLFNFSRINEAPFNLDLRLAADFLLVLEKIKNKPALRIPEVFVEVEPGGVSNVYIERVWEEKQIARGLVFGKFSLDYLLGILWTYAARLKRSIRIRSNHLKSTLYGRESKS